MIIETIAIHLGRSTNSTEKLLPPSMNETTVMIGNFI
jgi:hypothetical protein